MSGDSIILFGISNPRRVGVIQTMVELVKNESKEFLRTMQKALSKTISLWFNLKSEVLFISLGIGHTVPLYSNGGTNRSAHTTPNNKNIIFAHKLTNFTNLFLFDKTAANFARPNLIRIQFLFIVYRFHICTGSYFR